MNLRTLVSAGVVCIASAIIVVAIPACGKGSGNSPTSPTSPPASPGSAAATFTITASGVSPKTVTISVGQQVAFVNSDSRSHTMSSDPHPTHENCPPTNDVGFLAPNQTRLTGNFTTVRSCGFHDHDNPGNNTLDGTITIR